MRRRVNGAKDRCRAVPVRGYRRGRVPSPEDRGVPAADIGREVLKEIGRPPETMEPELEAGFLGPLILGNFRETFAPYIRNGETLVCVQAATDEQVEMAIDVLKLCTPIEVRIFPAAEGADP